MPNRIKGPVHKNSTGYDHMRHCRKNLPPDKVFIAMHAGMCRRCRAIMDWKKKYGKWRLISPVTQEAQQPWRWMCAHCGQKAVVHPFARLCKPCCQSLKKCAKCMKEQAEGDPLAPYPPTKVEQMQQTAKEHQSLQRLSERERRAIRRREAKGEAVEFESESDDDEDEEEEDDEDGAGAGAGAVVGRLSRCGLTDATASTRRRWAQQEQDLPRRTRRKRPAPDATPELELDPPEASAPVAAPVVEEDFSDEEEL